MGRWIFTSISITNSYMTSVEWYSSCFTPLHEREEEENYMGKRIMVVDDSTDVPTDDESRTQPGRAIQWSKRQTEGTPFPNSRANR